MADAQYETDILVWSEQQADLLRRAAVGERVNGLDWPNLIEEISAVGRAELHAVESLPGQALLRLLKMVGWPDAAAVPHWRAEALAFLRRAARQFAPGMRQRIVLRDIYEDALVQAGSDCIDGAAPLPLPPLCPLALDDLLSMPTDVTEFFRRLAAAAAG